MLWIVLYYWSPYLFKPKSFLSGLYGIICNVNIATNLTVQEMLYCATHFKVSLVSKHHYEDILIRQRNEDMNILKWPRNKSWIHKFTCMPFLHLLFTFMDSIRCSLYCMLLHQVAYSYNHLDNRRNSGTWWHGCRWSEGPASHPPPRFSTGITVNL